MYYSVLLGSIMSQSCTPKLDALFPPECVNVNLQ